MGDVTGWELGATYVTRSHPRLQDTVLSAQTPRVEWSERWGRYVPTGWPQEQVTVRRRELNHSRWCENPACTDREVSHSTPRDPAKWERADADLADLDAGTWASVRTVPGSTGGTR